MLLYLPLPALPAVPGPCSLPSRPSHPPSPLRNHALPLPCPTTPCPPAAVLSFLAASAPPNSSATAQCCFSSSSGATTLQYCLRPTIRMGATWASAALAAAANFTLGSCGYRDPLAGAASQACVESLLGWEIDVGAQLCMEVGGEEGGGAAGARRGKVHSGGGTAAQGRGRGSKQGEGRPGGANRYCGIVTAQPCGALHPMCPTHASLPRPLHPLMLRRTATPSGACPPWPPGLATT